MKVLTVAVPLYNTEDYIRRCLDSLTAHETLDALEVLVVNDGSRDRSLEIAREYETRFPETVRVIDKENGGHGSAVNRGLAEATGTYFRVVDSDDWVNITDFTRLIHALAEETADLVITDYRKETVFNSASEPLGYSELTDGTLYELDTMDLEELGGEYFVMATSTYRTALLREAGVKLSEKTFYVDMQFNLFPIPALKNFRYLSLDIYRYFIGRPDQSMNLSNFVKNRAAHEKVLRSLVEFYAEKAPALSENKRSYIENVLLYMIYTHYCIYVYYDKKPSRASRKEIRAFDDYMKERAPALYTLSAKYGKIRIHRKTGFVMLSFLPGLFLKLANAFTRG